MNFIVRLKETKYLRPYSKSKLELESNLSEILPVNCKFIHCSITAWVPEDWLEVQKERYKHRQKDFCITRVRLFRVQLKFGFRIRPL